MAKKYSNTAYLNALRKLNKWGQSTAKRSTPKTDPWAVEKAAKKKKEQEQKRLNNRPIIQKAIDKVLPGEQFRDTSTAKSRHIVNLPTPKAVKTPEVPTFPQATGLSAGKKISSSKKITVPNVSSQNPARRILDIATNAAEKGISLGLTGLVDKGVDYAFDKLTGPAKVKYETPKPKTRLEKGIASGTELATGLVSGTAAAKIASPVIKKTATNLGKVVSWAKKAPTVAKVAGTVGAGATGIETGRGALKKGYAQKSNTFPAKFGASLRAGTGDIATNLGNQAEWMGQKGIGQKLQNAGKNISEGFEEKPVEFTWKSLFDPDFYAVNVARTLPLSAALIPTMFAGYKAGSAGAGKLGLGKFGKAIMGSLAGAAVSRPLESAMEAGDTYQQAKQKGFSDEDADQAAQQVFKNNLKLSGIDAFELATAFTPATAVGGKIAELSKSTLGKAAINTGRVLGDTISEAGEEGFQQAFQQKALKEDDRGVLAQMFSNSTPDMKESMLIGGLLGGVMGGTGDIVEEIKNRTLEKLPAETQKQVTDSIEKGIQQGMDQSTASENAFNELAETPEGNAAITTATQEIAKEIDEEGKVSGENSKNAKKTIPVPKIARKMENVGISGTNLSEPVEPKQASVPEPETSETPEEATPVYEPGMVAVNPVGQQMIIVGEDTDNPNKSRVVSRDNPNETPYITDKQNVSLTGERAEKAEEVSPNIPSGEGFAPQENVSTQTGNSTPVRSEQPAESNTVEDKQTAKEPWQMTKQEYIDDAVKTTGHSVDVPHIAKGTMGNLWSSWHAKAVKQALSEGKVVPAEVLQDYPELSGQESAQNNASETGVQNTPDKLPAPAVKNAITQKQEEKTEQSELKEQVTPKVTFSGKLGRAGNKSLKKWTANEYVNADLNNPDDAKAQRFAKFFTSYYKAGFDGKRIIDVPQEEKNIEFPPFLEDEAYRAGQKDAETAQKKADSKSGKIPVPKQPQQAEKKAAQSEPKEKERTTVQANNAPKSKSEQETTEKHEPESAQNDNIEAKEEVSFTKGDICTNPKGDLFWVNDPIPDNNGLLHVITSSGNRWTVNPDRMHKTGENVSLDEWTKRNNEKQEEGEARNGQSNTPAESRETSSQTVQTGATGENGGKKLEGVSPSDVPGVSKERNTESGTSRSGAASNGTDQGDRAGYTGEESTIQNGHAGENRPVQHGEEDGRGHSNSGNDMSATGRRAGEHLDQRIKRGSGVNYVITEEDHLGEGGLKTKYNDNVAAIKLIKELQEQDRLATPEEQKVLVKYVGWGGMPQVFDFDNEGNPLNEKWANAARKLKELLTEEEWKAAKASTTNAHYTSAKIISAMWQGMSHIGFHGGKIIEPAIGAGHFFGLMPENIVHNSKLTGIELDKLTGAIAKQLYQNADIRIEGFEEFCRPAVKYGKALKHQAMDDYFDLAISNVPFSDKDKPYDPRYAQYNFALHDYFFAKALDKVRPGGVIAFITSRYTMDKVDFKLRDYVADRADLVTAIRLPNTAFKQNANTEVITDIIVLKKRESGTEYSGESFGDLTGVRLKNDKGRERYIRINEYWDKYPDHILGTQTLNGSMYGGEEYTVEPGNESVEDGIKRIFAALPNNLYVSSKPAEVKEEPVAVTEETAKIIDGTFLIVDGKLKQKREDQLLDPDLTSKDKERVIGMVEIRDAMSKLVDAENEGKPDSVLDGLRKKLNEVYDSFIDKFDYINTKKNIKLFDIDPYSSSIRSLEDYNTDMKTATKMPIFSERTISYSPHVDHADSTDDALLISLAERGRIDWERMAELTGYDINSMQKELLAKGVIFQTAEETFETADQYLSGNVREKLVQMKELVKIFPEYQVNVDALEKVQPEDLPYSKIDMRLGAVWVPADVINDFINKHLYRSDTNEVNVELVPGIGWAVNGTASSSYYGSDIDRNVWGTKDVSGLKLIDNILNAETPTVTVKDEDGKTYVDPEASLQAQIKAQEIKKEFKNWIDGQPDLANDLTKMYNWEMNNTRLRKYVGKYLKFPGMNPLLRLYEHQKNAVWRIIQSGNTLLAHVVGAGKTFEMIAAGMEMKRMGLVHKPVYVVPNHLIEQWERDFHFSYPGCNILVFNSNNLPDTDVSNKKNETDEQHKARKIKNASDRKLALSKIVTGNWDAILVPYTIFTRLPMSIQVQQQFKQRQLDELEVLLREAKSNNDNSRTTVKQIEKAIKRLKSELDKLVDDIDKDIVIPFDKLGIDFMFVDESHSFKNIWFATKMNRVAGISPTNANRAMDMLMKCEWLSQVTNEHGVVFATGTPVSNTMAELFNIQRCLQPTIMREYNIHSFDLWANTFGDVVPSVEKSIDGTAYHVVNRFAKFTNIPELMQIFLQVADVKMADKLDLKVPKIETGKPITVACPEHPLMHDFNVWLNSRVKSCEAHKADRDYSKFDNYLMITNDARNAAVDIRLFDPSLPEFEGSKINRCVDKVYKEWAGGKDEKLTQLIFCDLGIPKPQKDTLVKSDKELEQGNKEDDAPEDAANLQIYQEIKQKLIAKGLPAKEIAFIHDAKNPAQKRTLSQKMKEGKVRVLIGSTGKCGTGLNIQDRMVALHNIDCPWKPADLEQRIGRILRQGNQNKSIRIYNYVSIGSFDVRAWQIIETKLGFIKQIMNGDTSTREANDVGDIMLDPADSKAIATNNPLEFKKIDLDKKIKNLEAAEDQWRDSIIKAKQSINTTKDSLERHKKWLKEYKEDKAGLQDTHGDKFTITFKDIALAKSNEKLLKGGTYTKRKEAGEQLLKLRHAIYSGMSSLNGKKIGSFAGYTLKINEHATDSDTRGYGCVEIVTPNNSYQIQLSDEADTKPEGIVSSLETRTRTMADWQIDYQTKEIATLERDLQASEELINKPFGNAKELEETRKERNDVYEKLGLKSGNLTEEEKRKIEAEERAREQAERDRVLKTEHGSKWQVGLRKRYDARRAKKASKALKAGTNLPIKEYKKLKRLPDTKDMFKATNILNGTKYGGTERWVLEKDVIDRELMLEQINNVKPQESYERAYIRAVDSAGNGDTLKPVAMTKKGLVVLAKDKSSESSVYFANQKYYEYFTRVMGLSIKGPDTTQEHCMQLGIFKDGKKVGAVVRARIKSGDMGLPAKEQLTVQDIEDTIDRLMHPQDQEVVISDAEEQNPANTRNSKGKNREKNRLKEIPVPQVGKANGTPENNREFFIAPASEKQRFSDQLDKWANGELDTNKVITVCSTPKVLQELGAKDLPMVISLDTIEKAIYPLKQGPRGKGKHELSLDLIKQLPEQLYNPIMVFDSKNNLKPAFIKKGWKSLVVMTELQHEGKTVVVAVHLSKKEDWHIVNNIASVHPREDDEHFINWIKKGLLRYINKKKAQNWFRPRGLQLPKGKPNEPSTTNILTENDIVNAENDSNLYNTSLAKSAKREQARLEHSSSNSIKKQQILDYISKNLGVPIDVGRFNRKNASGIYKLIPHVIRTKKAGDLPVIAHEVGHRLSQMMNIKWHIHDDGTKEELKALALEEGQATEETKPSRQIEEGIAEFTSIYMVNPPEAAERCPVFMKLSEELAQENGLKEFIDNLQSMFNTWYDQTSRERLRGVLSVGEKNDKTISRSELYRKVYDELAPLANTVDRLSELSGKAIASKDNPFYVAWKGRGVTGKVEAFLNYGVVDENGNKISKSLQEILSSVKDIDVLRDYMVAKHAIELHQQGKELTPISVRDAQNVIKDTPREYEKAAQDLIEYQDAVTDQLVKSGFITIDKTSKWRKMYPYYVPFYRVFDSLSEAASGGKKAANLGQAIHSMKKKGSGRDIVDPLESIIKNTYLYLNLSERNEIGKSLAELCDKTEGSGEIMEKVDAKKYPITFSLEQISKAIEKAGGKIEDMDMDSMAKIFSPVFTPSSTENVVVVWRDGKPQMYKVRDPELYNTLLALNFQTSNMLIKACSYAAQVLRVGVTTNPYYIPKNPGRDLMTLLLQSDSYTGLDYVHVPIDLGKALFHVLKQDEKYWQWKSAGAAHADMMSVGREYLQESLSQLIKTKGKDKAIRALNVPGNIYKALRYFSQTLEEVTRLTEFTQSMKKTGDVVLSAIRSRDITVDFDRKGSDLKNMNRITAFFNAALQGPEKMYRTHKEHPLRSIMRGMLFVMLPSLALWFINHDDPDYEELPRWRRDLFWEIPMGNGRFFPLPKPFEWGVIYGTVPERILDWLYDHDPHALEGFGDTLKNTFVPDLIPTILQGWIEVWANKKFISGGKIVPDRELNLPKSEQYGAYTTETAKLIGKAINQSPRNIDALVQAYAGGLGTLAMGGADVLIRKAQGNKNSIPTPKTFIKPGYGQSQTIDDFYNDLAKMEADYSKKGKNGNPPSALSAMRKTAKDLSDLRKEEGKINDDPDLSGKKKRKRLDEIDLKMTNKARKRMGKIPIPTK